MSSVICRSRDWPMPAAGIAVGQVNISVNVACKTNWVAAIGSQWNRDTSP